MPEGALSQSQRANPTALTLVILLHGAAITALALAKMDVVSNPFEPIKVIQIKEALPPPEVPPEPIKKVEPQHETVIDRVPSIVPTPSEPFFIDRTPVRPIPVPYTPPAQETILPPPPPPPPPPKKLEPARAKANLASYVSDADYPSAAIRGEEQGTTRFRLTVGPDGRVAECTVTGTSGSSALDAATCRIMKNRAKFTPARDSDGQPTGDTVSSAIRWVLPEG